MRAVQIIAPGQATFVEVPKPTLQPGQALIRTTQVSLCGSDTHAVYHHSPSAYPLPPGNSGHEVLGIVEEMNGSAAHVKVGDEALALVQTNQGMAEYAVLPIENLLALPAGKPVEELLQAQQLGTVLYAAQHMPNVVNKDVVIIGPGSAGLWWNYVVSRMGARRVIAVDLQAHRLALSSHYGATHTINNAEQEALPLLAEILDGRLADIVVEAAGEPESINLTTDLVRRYGFIFFFGVPRGHEMNFRMFDFFRKSPQTQSMVGALGDPGHSCTRIAMDLIASGAADVGPMITHHFDFEQVPEAYELQNTRDEGALKIVVNMPRNA